MEIITNGFGNGNLGFILPATKRKNKNACYKTYNNSNSKNLLLSYADNMHKITINVVKYLN